MNVELDHLLWAAPDLDDGAELFAKLTGVTPARGGSHPGFGTRNCLAALGGGRYLEIISPDPAQSLHGNRGGLIAAMARPALMTFAVRTQDLAGYRAAALSAGACVDGPVAMGRTRPDGVRLDWACVYVDHPDFAEFIPFAIDWKSSPHPSGTTPTGVGLRRLEVLHPRADDLAEIYRGLDVPVSVRQAARAELIAVLSTPRGDVTLVGP